MYFNKEKNENDEESKRNVVNKNMVNHKNKKYVRNIRQSVYNIKYINKFYKRNNDIRVKKGNNGTTFNNNSLSSNNLKLESKNNQQSYFNKNSANRNNKENTRLNAYKKNYFDQDNINYNSLINSQTSVCSIHIEKTDDDIKNQIKCTESYLYDNRNNSNEISQQNYPMFVEEINFNENLVLLTGILILSSNDKIFNNLEFEGKTHPSPIDCNLSIYVNVVNKYNYHYFKQLYPVSYNFKNRLLFASLNNSTIDSSLLIDKIIIKGCFKTLSLIVLGQSEEINEALKYYRENFYDSNLRSKINEETLDVENVDLEKDEIYAPKKSVDIKTYNINTLMEENVTWKKYNKMDYFHEDYLSEEDNHKELYKLSNILEEEFIKNNFQKMNNSDNNYLKSEMKKEEVGISYENDIKNNEEIIMNSKNNEMCENIKNNENNDANYTDSKLDEDNEEKYMNYFIPPRNDLIVKILNLLTEIYKSKKEICKSDILIYKKIIKYGALWLFYIYKNIKNKEENFLINYSEYMQIKIHDILGCLLILRRCALYSDLAKYIIHMNFNSDVLYFDNKSPHVLIYLIDMLHVNNIYFLSSWKIKTSILKTIIAIISNSYVMNLFCNYVDESNESSYIKLLKLSSTNKMKRYNIKRLLGIIMSKVKLFEEINKFESSIIDIILNRRNYDKTLFSKKFISKFIYELKSVHKELFQHTCNHESKNSCYDALYENEIFVFNEKNKKKNNFYLHKLHNYIISYLQRNQFFTLFIYILKEFEVHIKNSLFLNSYDICFITAVNEFLFYFLNCSGGINLLTNYNIELFENLYKSICLIINRKMKELNANINDKNNDLNKLKGNDDNCTEANEQILQNNENRIDDIDNLSEDNIKIKNSENELSYEFEDPYSENAALKDKNKSTSLNDNKNIINMSYKNDNVNEFLNTTDSLKTIESENTVNINNSTCENNTKEEKELLNSLDDISDDFIYNEKNFYYDNLKCVYTYNDILRNKDISEKFYLDGYNYKDIKNTRNYCSFILCSLKTFSRVDILINNFFNLGEEISLEYLKFFNVLCSYPLSKLALYNNNNFYNFFLHIIYLFYYFIHLEKLYENKMNESTKKKDKIDNSNEEEEDNKEKKKDEKEKEKERKKNYAKNLSISNKIEENDTNSNEFVLISIRYILNIIYNLIFYDESGYFIFHFGYSIFVCLEEIRNITGEIKKKKDYSFGTLNYNVPKKIFLKDYISSDKLFYKYFFYLYENLKNLYIDLYRYEKKKFNEMHINKKKESYKESIFNILNKYNQELNKSYINKINDDKRNRSINNDINKIKQNLFNNEEIFINLLPLKSNYTPNVNKIIESCKIEKDKYSLKKSKELNNYNCKLNNDIYINQSTKNCTRLGSTNNQYVELLEELDDNPSNNLSKKLDTYPFLSLNLLYYYMNLCYNIYYFMNVYENEKDESNQEKEFFFINNSGFFYNNDFEYNNYICIKNDKIDEINKPIKDVYYTKKKSKENKIFREENNYVSNDEKEIFSDDYLNSINYINKYDQNNFKNIGTILYNENNLEFLIKLISKSIFFLNVNIFKLALLNFNKLSGRNLYRILKNRLKSIFFVKSVLNILFNFFYNLTYNNNSITLKSYRNNELLYSLLYLLTKLLSFNDWLGSNNVSEYNHHSSIFVLRYNIIYILRIFYIWFNKTSDNQSFLFRCVLKYTRSIPSFSTAGMLLILTFFDFKNIFPDYIYSFYITNNLKNICYDSIKNNVKSNEGDTEEEEEEEILEESELEENNEEEKEDEYTIEHETEQKHEQNEDYIKKIENENKEKECEQYIGQDNIYSNIIKEENKGGDSYKDYSEEEKICEEKENKKRIIDNEMNRKVKDKENEHPNDIIDDDLYYELYEEQNCNKYKYEMLNEEKTSYEDIPSSDNTKHKLDENINYSRNIKIEKDNNIIEDELSKENEKNENRKEDRNEVLNNKIYKDNNNLHNNTNIKNENSDIKEYEDIINRNSKNLNTINNNIKEKRYLNDSSIIKNSHKYDKLTLCKNNYETFNYYSHILNNSSINYFSDLEDEEEDEDREKEENDELIENKRENINNNIIKEKKEDYKENLNKEKDLEKIILYCKLSNPFNIEKRRNLYLCCSINIKKKIMNEKYCEFFRIFNLNYSSDDYEEVFYSDNNKKSNDNYVSMIGNLTINLKDLNENENSNDDANNQANYNCFDEDALKNYIGNKIKGISFLSTDKIYKNKKNLRDLHNENNNLNILSNNDDNNFMRNNDKKENDYLNYKNKVEDKNNKEKLYYNKSEGATSPFSIKNFLQDSDEVHYENILDKLRRKEYLFDQNINMNSLKEEEKEKLTLIRKELKIREYTSFEDFCDYINFIIRVSKSNNVIGRCLSAYCCVIFINHRIPIFSILFEYVRKTINNIKNLNSFNKNNDSNTSICMNKINYFSFFSYNNTQSNNAYYTYNQEIYHLKELCNVFSFILDILKICFFNNYKNNYNKLIKLIYFPSKKLLNMLYNMIKNLKKVFPQELIRFIIKLSSTIFHGYAYVLFIFFNKHNILYNEDKFKITCLKEDVNENFDNNNNILFINKEVYYKEKEFIINQSIEEKRINRYQNLNNNYKKKILFSCPNFIKYINFFINYFFELINTKNIVDNNNKEILYKYADYIDIKTVNLCLINIYEIVKNKILYFFTFFNVEKKLINFFFRYIHNYKDKMKRKTVFQKNNSLSMEEYIENHNNEIIYIHVYDFYIKLNEHINIGKLLEFFSFYFDIIEETNYKIIELYEYINIIDIILNIILKIINYNFNSLFILMHLILNDNSFTMKFIKIQQNKNNFERQKSFKEKKKISHRNGNEKINNDDINYIEDFKNNFLNNLLNSLNNLYAFIVNAIEKNCDEDTNNTKEKDLINKKEKALESSYISGINTNEKTNNEISNQDININQNSSLYILSKIILSMIDKLKSIKKKVLNLNSSFASNITFKNFLLFTCYDIKELNILYMNQNIKKHRKNSLDSALLSCEISLKRRKIEEKKQLLDNNNDEIKTDLNQEIENNNNEVHVINLYNVNELDEYKSNNEINEINENGLDKIEVNDNNLNENDTNENTVDTNILNRIFLKDDKSKDYSFFFENVFNDINLAINNKYLFSKLSDIFFSKSILNKIIKSFESHQHLDDNYLITIKNINSNNLIPSVNKKLYDHCSHILCDIQSNIYLNENDEDRKSFTLFNIAQENKSKEIDENHSLYNYIRLLKEENNKLQKKKIDLNTQLMQSKGKQFKRIDKNTFEDHFRNRKTLSSRAPSKHVDDYEATNATINNTTTNNNNNNENDETNNENNENIDINNKNKFNNVINKNISNQENKTSNTINSNLNKINVNNNINNSNDFMTNINNDNTTTSSNANNIKNENSNITLNKNNLTNNLVNKIGIDANKEMKPNDPKHMDNSIKMVPSKVNILRNSKKFHNPNYINKENYNNMNNDSYNDNYNNDNYNDNFNYNSQNINSYDNYNYESYNNDNYDNFNNYNNNINSYNNNYNYDNDIANNAGIDNIHSSNYSFNSNNNINLNNVAEANNNIKSDVNNNKNIKIYDYNNIINNENISTLHMKSHHNISDTNPPFFNYNKNDINNNSNNDIEIKDSNNNITHDTNENNNSQNSNYISSNNSDVNNSHFFDSPNLKHINNNGNQNNISKNATNEIKETNELSKNSNFDDCDCYKFNVLGWKEFSQDGHKNDLDVCKIVNKPVLLRDPRIKMKFLKILDRHKNIKDIFKRLGVDIK
ncbi:conserved Plasmodium protein, unknown function [Plasmodium relictum]|uniref:Uncharacterized protein n=1 Tax=Plasmodium relictum TaxID=85471 RepID=A0A1J1HAR1_PLARL|nr:conserved Plasmodium protein, unknown function [Plasmodium relictum]CRH00695.1 conserved Plasmodium protein, unknown function [Plasmodium relictum]